jgi:hypothetical protein
MATIAAVNDARGIPSTDGRPGGFGAVQMGGGGHGLLRIVSPDQLAAADREAERVAEGERKAKESVTTELAAYIQKCWEAAKSAKTEVEARILDCRRQIKGEYDPAILAQIRKMGGSETFLNTTLTKHEACKSWITDVLLPPDDKPWEISPTPIPDLPDDAIRQVVAKVENLYNQAVLAGQQMTPEQAFALAGELRDLALEDIQEKAAKIAKNVEKQIEDDLLEAHYYDVLADFIDDFAAVPAAIIKGPVVRNRKVMTWENGKSAAKDRLVREIERVDPLDFYPSPHCRTVDDYFLIERQRLTRKTLQEYRGVDGVNIAELDKALEEHGESGYSTNLAVDTSRDQAEGRSSVQQQTHSDVTIETLEFWGSVSGQMLLNWGLKVGEATAEYEIQAIQVGRHVIKAMVNPDPLGRRPYYVDSFCHVPGSLWGKALPEILKDVQQVMNSQTRAYQNNQGMCSGPQVGVDYESLMPGTDVTSMHPWKIWPFKKTNGNTPPIQFFQPTSYTNEFIAGFKFFLDIQDDVSGIPRYAYGQDQAGGAGQTASGLSMLMGNTAKRLRTVIGSIDRRIIRQLIERFYTHIITHTEDKELMGDCRIVARGSMALIVKEQMQARRQDFLNNTNNPVDLQIIGIQGRARLLRSVAQALDLPVDKIVPNESALEQKMMAAANQPPPGALPPGRLLNRFRGSPPRPVPARDNRHRPT